MHSCGFTHTIRHRTILVIKTRNTTSDEFENAVSVKFEITSDHEHTFGDWEKVDDDYHSRSCECGYFEKAEHSWNEGVVTTEPTCTERGVKTYTCGDCGATKTEAIDTVDHTYGPWEKNDENKHKKVCDVCGYTACEDHSWNEGVVTTEPTCTERGVKTYTCSTCDATKTEIVGATGHSFGDWTEVGDHHERTCSNCQKVEGEDHEWGEGKVISEPSCTERGVTVYTCTKCDATKTEIVGATGHSFGDWTEKDGNEHTRVCSKCQTPETEAHSWDGGDITSEPTCTENGTITYTCAYCEATKTEIVGANGHHLTEWIYFDKDTHRNNCDVCDHFEEGTHTWTTNGPSEDGLTTYICGGCNATKVEATVTAETDGGSATVSGDTISDILSQMEGSADEKRVSIDTAGMGKVVLDQNSVSGLTSADAIVDLTFGEGTLTISKDVLNTVSDGTSPISISMNGVQKEELTDAQKEAVGDGLVFRFEASAGEEKIHELGGTVTVSVKYEPKKGEDVSALKAYYVDDEGELHLVGGYYDGSGHFVFDTDHFSYYVVKGAQENGGGDDGGDMTVYVAVAAVAIILLAVLGFVYMRRH